MSDLADSATESGDLLGIMLPEYSKRELVEAGRLLTQRLPYPLSEEAYNAFTIAHGWRVAHLPAMREVRSELSRSAKRLRFYSLTAARLKRLWSIRKKMRSKPLSLYEIQDIGGCRAILGSMSQVNALAEFYRNGKSKFAVRRDNDYIAEPRCSGYRSQHFVLRVEGGQAVGIGKRRWIEVQLRTRLQHSWATAVEAVGLVRREDLKGGSGNADWLRLFLLMSAEMAQDEGCSIVAGVPTDRRDRLAELLTLERGLNAIAHLEGCNHAIQHVEGLSLRPGGAYLVKFDFEKHRVNVRSNYMFQATADELLAAEAKGGQNNSVIIEVDRVSDLKAAYPNYFLDVSAFNDRLKNAIRDAHGEVIVPPEEASRLSRWGKLADVLESYNLRKWK